MAEAPAARSSTQRARTNGELVRRMGTAGLGLPVFLGAVVIGGSVLRVVLALLVLAAAWEWVRLGRRAGHQPAPEVVLPGAVALSIVVMLRSPVASWVPMLLVVAALVAQFPAPRRAQALANAGVTVLGPIYVSLLAALDLIRALPRGAALALLVLAAVWIGDAAAYFWGRAFGRRRLAPAISPGKTWEGALAGLAGAVGAAAVAAAVLRLPIGAAVLVGAVAAVAGLLGDLAESALKRSAGVKDTGTLLPGHGGILDRFDALFFAAPAAYALLWRGVL